MSEATYAALEQAIRDHITDEQGTPQLLTDWHMIAASLSDEADSTGYTHATSNSSWHSMRGLLVRAERELELDEAEDDDE